jgi:hypothetical protein
VRLEEEESVASAARFLEGSLIRPLQAVWRDFAALGSFRAVDIASRSAEAISAMLVHVRICLGKGGVALPA